MPKTTAKVSNRPRWLGTKEGFAKHHLVGANTVMLTLLRDNAAALDVNAANLDLGINRARDMLQSAATVEIVSASVANGQLEARVRVENHSGHKAPTSYPSRRMWLHFKVTDSNGNVVFESGSIDNGFITGADDDVDQTGYEPHYNLITSAKQVQIYEAIMGDSGGDITYTLLRGAQYLKDNRLTPKGFDKSNAPDDVAVHGLAATDDPDFNLGSDEVTYSVPVAASGDLNVSVSLNYQTISHGFLQDLYSASHLEQVRTFQAMYDAQELKHELVASAQTTVVSDGGGTPPVVPEYTAPVIEPPALVAPTVNLTASPSSVARGGSITLSWSSTDADSCTASDNWSGSKATSGSQAITLNSPATFTLSCSGDGGSASGSVSYQARGRRWLELR